MPGSTIKTCISCREHIGVACKICKLCGAQQEMKKALHKATEKASKQWGAKLKKGGNTSKLVDAARVLVHKFKMAGLHPILLFGTNKRGSLSCDYLNGLEVVKDTDNASMAAVRSLYESLLSVIIRREKANTLTPVDPERPRELAESPLHPGAKVEEEKPFSLFLTPCDPAPTAPATAPSTSHWPPGQSSPSSCPSLPLSNSKDSCQPKYPVIIRRKKANTLTPVDPERPRELAESPLHPGAKVEEEEEEEKTFSLFLTPCDPAPTAPATAPSTSHWPPGQSSPSSCPSLPLSNSKDSCQPKYPALRKRSHEPLHETTLVQFRRGRRTLKIRSKGVMDTQSNGLVKKFNSKSSEPGISNNPHGAGSTKRRLCRDELEESPSKRQAKGQTFTTAENSLDPDMDLFAPLESDVDESANSVPEQQSSDPTPPAMVVKCLQVVKEEEEEEEVKKDEGSSPDQNTAGPSVPQQSSTGSPPSADQSKPLSPPGSPPCTSSSSSKAPPETICVSSSLHPVEPPSDPEPSIDSQSFWKSCNAAGCTQAIFTDFINEMKDIAGRIQSDQASEEDCNHALKVMAASGKLEEIVAKQQKELQRKQQELMKAAAAMQQFISAPRR